MKGWYYWEIRTCWRNNYSTRKNRGKIKQIEKSIIKMEHYEISKLLNYSTVLKFVKLVEVNDSSSGQCSVNKIIRFKTLMLISDLCDYNDADIVVKGTITVQETNDAYKRNTKLTFKNNVPFRSCRSKINNTFIENAGNLDIVIPMYNLLEYSENYSVASRSLWNYFRDEVNDSANENNDAKQKHVNLLSISQK